MAKRIVIWGLLFLSILILKDFIVPLIFAGLVTLSIYPLYQKMLKIFPRPRITAGFLVSALGIGFLVPLALLVITGITETKLFLSQNDWAQLQTLITSQWADQSKNLVEFARQYNYELNIDQIQSYAYNFATGMGSKIFGFAEGSIKNLPFFLLNLFIFIFGMYVFLLGSEGAHKWYTKLWPLTPATGEEFLKKLLTVAKSIVTANLVAALLQTLTVLFFGLITGTKYTLILSLATFILTFVPMIGTLPVSLGLIGMAYLSSNWTHLILFLVMMGCLGIIDNFIKPLIIGKNTRVHPVLAFLSAIGGLTAFGVVGLFIGPILVGVLLEYLHE